MLPIGSTAVISLFMSLPAQPDRVVVGPKPQKVEETFVEAPEGIEVEVWVEYLHYMGGSFPHWQTAPLRSTWKSVLAPLTVWSTSLTQSSLSDDRVFQ